MGIPRWRGVWFAVLAAAVILPLYSLANFDIYWHLANGRYMAETGAILAAEVHSYTRPGVAFSNHAWLSQWIFYLTYAAAGTGALVVLKWLLSALTLGCVYRVHRTLGVPPLLSAVSCLAAFHAIVYRLSVRPHLFTLLLLAACSWLCWAIARRRVGPAWAALIPVAILVWDVLHGAVMGLAFVLSFAGGTVLLALFGEQRAGAWRPTVWLSGGAIAALCCAALAPFGSLAGSFFVMLLESSEMVRAVGEFRRTPVIEGSLPFWGFWVLGVLTAGAALKDRDWPVAGVLVPFLFLGWQYARATAPYVLVAAPLIAERVARLPVGDRMRRIAERLTVVAAVLLLGYTLWYKLAADGINRLGWGEHESYHPHATLAFAEDRQISGRLFNSGELGGFIAFHQPHRKIFLYNHHTVFGDLFDALRAPDALARWRIDYAVVDDYFRYRHLLPIAHWAPVYWERGAMLLVPRTPKHHELIREHEIRYFTPFRSVERLRELAASPEIRTALVRELEGHLAYRADPTLAGLLEELRDGR